jgi:hypothetical protein
MYLQWMGDPTLELFEKNQQVEHDQGKKRLSYERLGYMAIDISSEDTLRDVRS